MIVVLGLLRKGAKQNMEQPFHFATPRISIYSNQTEMPSKIPTVISEPAKMRALTDGLKQKGKTVGCIPTMGALHEGHLSLARASVAATDVSVATIFVNPTQFAPGEDLDSYPRRLEEDLQLLGSIGVDYVFCPQAETMYPAGSSTSVVPPKISKKLEGEFRPTHFAGVATIVLKLLNIVGPTTAFFGQKDFQQVAVIKQMVADFDVPVKIETCPIVRDDDGLALSSRNAYLSEDEREIALTINRTLKHIQQQIQDGQRDSFESRDRDATNVDRWRRELDRLRGGR